VIFNGTPCGPNHGQTLFEHARSDPDWFCQKLTAHETGVLTPEELESERRNFVGLYGQDHGESMFQQEYECSFTAAVFGTFYGREMAEAEREGRICRVHLNRSLPIYTSWDLGYTDATAIWFVQKVGREIRLVGYYESSGHGLRHYVELLEHLVAEHDVCFGGHILPHDVKVKELDSGKSRLEMLEAMGMVDRHLGRIEVALALHDEDEIAAVRSVLPRCWFDEGDCKRGIDALKLYRAKWDEERKVLTRKAVHDWTSHSAHAFAYLAVTIDNLRVLAAAFTARSATQEQEYSNVIL
jgi:phage terminase large subunit